MQEPEPINWEYYRKGIGAGIVDMYKEAYDSKFYIFSANLNVEQNLSSYSTYERMCDLEI